MVNILARILDSERNFNGSADPMITADRGFIQFLGWDFGFWLLESSDRGSQRSPGNLTFSLLCADFLSGSTDSAINFSGSADLHTSSPPL